MALRAQICADGYFMGQIVQLIMVEKHFVIRRILKSSFENPSFFYPIRTENVSNNSFL
jgi:hypothetical protein